MPVSKSSFPKKEQITYKTVDTEIQHLVEHFSYKKGKEWTTILSRVALYFEIYLFSTQSLESDIFELPVRFSCKPLDYFCSCWFIVPWELWIFRNTDVIGQLFTVKYFDLVYLKYNIFFYECSVLCLWPNNPSIRILSLHTCTYTNKHIPTNKRHTD